MLYVISELVWKFVSDQKRVFGMEWKQNETNIWPDEDPNIVSWCLYPGVSEFMFLCRSYKESYCVCALCRRRDFTLYTAAAIDFGLILVPVCCLFDPQFWLQSGNCTTMNVPAVCLLEWEVLITQGCLKPYPWGYSVCWRIIITWQTVDFLGAPVLLMNVRRNLPPIFFKKKKKKKKKEFLPWKHFERYNISA